MITKLKKIIRKAQKEFVNQDVKINYDETSVNRVEYLANNNIFIRGDSDIVCHLNSVLSAWGGSYNERIEECTKFIIVSDFQHDIFNLSIADKWNDIARKMKDAFFISVECAKNCMDRKARGVILHIILTNEEIVPYRHMIQGLAKKLGPSSIRINGIMLDKQVIEAGGMMVAYLLNRHSAHITGECINMDCCIHREDVV